MKSTDHTDKEKAFLRLVEGHKGILYKICRLYQDREEDRQDLLQEIMAQLWVSYDSFRGESAFSSWMYRVALNTAIVFLKRGRRESDRLIHGAYPDLAEELRPVRQQEERLAIFYRAVAQLDKLEAGRCVASRCFGEDRVCHRQDQAEYADGVCVGGHRLWSDAGLCVVAWPDAVLVFGDLCGIVPDPSDYLLFFSVLFVLPSDGLVRSWIEEASPQVRV